MKKLLAILLFTLTTLSLLAAMQPQGDKGSSEKPVIEVTFEVKPIANLNSKKSDFSPILLNNQLYFTSDREKDLLLVGENRWKKKSYLSVYATEVKSSLNDTVILGKIKHVDHTQATDHSGPICFAAGGKEVYFTRVDVKSKKGIYKPKLYSATVDEKGKWNDIALLPFVKDESSYGHPTVSPNGQQLVFASDMGGQGGKDLFVSSKEGDGWSTPVNLGAQVNSNGDELFPCWFKETLYFSSNGMGGEGNLDLFKVSKDENGNWGEPENLGPTINSESDDFGIVFNKNGETGYFSSNRSEGNGSDDIYYFRRIENIIVSTKDLLGQFKYRTLGRDASGMKVLLLNDDGEVVYTAYTEKDGKFAFKNLPMDGTYTIRLENNDEDIELTIFDDENSPIAFYMRNSNGDFVYRKLNYDHVSTLSLVDEVDIDLSLNTAMLSGQFIYENLPHDFPDKMKVHLVDDDGQIAFSTATDKFGNFNFKDLPLDKNYILKVDDDSGDLTLLIYNRSNNITAELKRNAKGEFVYRKLSKDYANNLKLVEGDEELFPNTMMTVFGLVRYKATGKEVTQGITIQVLDKDGNVILTTKTDPKGYFRFKNLPLDESFVLKVDENDPGLDADMEIVILSRDGEKVAVLVKNKNGFFVYNLLDADKSTVAKIEEKDIELVLKSGKLPKIFYAYNSSYLDEESAEVLRQIADKMQKDSRLKLEVNSHTDARASDKYNLDLSNRRTNGVISYLLRKGIDRKRLSGNGFGETQLVNKCKNGVNCPDELHRENRRTEFKFFE